MCVPGLTPLPGQRTATRTAAPGNDFALPPGTALHAYRCAEGLRALRSQKNRMTPQNLKQRDPVSCQRRTRGSKGSKQIFEPDATGGDGGRSTSADRLRRIRAGGQKHRLHLFELEDLDGGGMRDMLISRLYTRRDIILDFQK